MFNFQELVYKKLRLGTQVMENELTIQLINKY